MQLPGGFAACRRASVRVWSLAPGGGEGVVHHQAAVHGKGGVQGRDALLWGGGERLFKVYKLGAG